MLLRTPVQARARRQQRLTVAAAALGILCVLLLPPLLGRVLTPVAPIPGPQAELTERARAIARMPGAAVLDDTVVVTVTPAMNASATAESQRVRPSESAGYLVPLGVSGLVPMSPGVAPERMRDLAGRLTPRDHVLANLGPLVVGCLRAWHDRPGECTPLLLTRHSTGYYRYPVRWGTGGFLEPGSPMQAQVLTVLGGRLVVGGMAGTDAARIEVRMDDGSSVTAFTTPSASPGDTVWWAVGTGSAVRADAYDASGELIARVHLVSGSSTS
jgi:hypothetical protein